MIRFNVFPNAFEELEWDADELVERVELEKAHKEVQPFVLLETNERVCNLFCVGCDKPRGECSCGCVMSEWRPVERVG